MPMTPPPRAPTDLVIADCLLQAQSNSDEAQELALQALSSLTKVSTQNRNLLALADDAIPTILSLSMSSSIPVQLLSLSILFNLSLNPNLKRSLASLEIIRHLNSLILSPPSPDAGKLAASLVCSLAMLDKNKAIFGVAGTIQAIVKALSNVASGRVAAHHLLSSLAELAQFHGNCTLAVRAGAVPVLIRIVESPVEELAGTCLSVLGLLSRYEEGIEEIKVAQGVVSMLVFALKRGCMVSRESAAEILVNLFEESTECTREAVGETEFPGLIADLSIRGSAKAREKAGVLMKMMMEVNLDSYSDDETNDLLIN